MNGMDTGVLRHLEMFNTIKLDSTQIEAGAIALELFAEKVESVKGVNYTDLLQESMDGLDDATQSVVKSFVDTEQAAGDLTQSVSDLPALFTKSASAALNLTPILATLKSMAISAAISLAITGAIKLFDSLVHYEENQLEKVSELTDAYNNLKAESESLQQELSSVEEKINELNSQESLTLVEQEELDKLHAQSVELKNQIYLMEQRKQLAAQEAEEAAHKTVNSKTEFSDYGPKTSNNRMTKAEKLEENIAGMRDLYAQITALNEEMNDGIQNGFEGKAYGSAEAYQRKIESLKDRYDDLKGSALELQSSLEDQAAAFVGATEAGNEDKAAITAVVDALTLCLQETDSSTAATEGYTAAVEEEASAAEQAASKLEEHAAAANTVTEELSKVWAGLLRQPKGAE